MALKLIANYSKRLGLPGYSSHQFSVCVETEISNIDDISGESTRLYETLQQSVDREIQQIGFVPNETYGRNGHSNGHSNGNGHTTAPGDSWGCSEKQRELILKLVDELALDKGHVDETSRDMFGVGVRDLNKLQASGLIDRLIEDNGGKPGNRRPQSRSTPPRRTFGKGGGR